MFININGEFFTEKDAKVSVFDHGLLYADGVYETMRCYNNKIFMLKEHISRLFDSAKSINLSIPYSQDEIRSMVTKTLEVNNLTDARIRITLTRGVGDFGLVGKCEPNIIIITRKVENKRKKPVKVITFDGERTLPEVKSLNFLVNILAMQKASQKKASEALLVDRDGHITEGTTSNVFIIKDNTLITPDKDILKGITREIILNITDLKVEKRFFTRQDLYNADECFITGSVKEIVPVIWADKTIIGTGKPGINTLKLMKKFQDATLQ